MQIMWNVNWPLVGLLFWREATLSYFYSMISFGYLERDYSLSKGDITLGKVLSSQHGKDVQLHSSLGSLTIWKILSKQVLHKSVDSCA